MKKTLILTTAFVLLAISTPAIAGGPNSGPNSGRDVYQFGHAGIKQVWLNYAVTDQYAREGYYKRIARSNPNNVFHHNTYIDTVNHNTSQAFANANFVTCGGGGGTVNCNVHQANKQKAEDNTVAAQAVTTGSADDQEININEGGGYGY